MWVEKYRQLEIRKTEMSHKMATVLRTSGFKKMRFNAKRRVWKYRTATKLRTEVSRYNPLIIMKTNNWKYMRVNDCGLLKALKQCCVDVARNIACAGAASKRPVHNKYWWWKADQRPNSLCVDTCSARSGSVRTARKANTAERYLLQSSARSAAGATIIGSVLNNNSHHRFK